MARRVACAALVMLIATASGACYQPPEPDCGFLCGSGGACPSDYTCGADQRCHRAGSPEGECASEFAVVSAQSAGVNAVFVTFSDPPDPVTAGIVANYAISNLSLSNDLPPQVSGNLVILDTATQVAQQYTLLVANVTRWSDGQPLKVDTASFVGRTSFNLTSATAPNAHTIDLQFDAAPATAQVFDVTSYTVIEAGGAPLAILSAQPVGVSTVELQTSVQDGEHAMVSVHGLVRASDGEPLSNNSTQLMTVPPFSVLEAAASDTQDVTVTFTQPPSPASAANTSSYAITSASAQLALTSAPVVNADGSVQLHTEAQRGVTYSLAVTGVVRGSDGEPLEPFGPALFAGIDHCTDSVRDGDETDVDCGGSACVTCAAGKSCLRPTDCTSGTCTSGLCQ